MEELNKSIDTLIDELFVDSVAKSMIKDANPAKETSDEVVKMAPKAEKDEARGAGRPKQISEIPQVDVDGKRSGEYDDSIAEKQEDAKKKEDSQVSPAEIMKKSISDSEYQEYQELKKAKVAKETAEILQKARQEQSDLIKSAVSEAISAVKAENESLRKSMQEQSDLIKAIANKPQQSKAITNVAAVEKFQKSQTSNTLSKAEILDVAEELVKSKELDMTSVIELENTGFIYDAEARGILERGIKRRYK
jgi:hypothetical protein